MWRLFALLALIVANLGYFGWNQGWFAPGLPPPRSAESEPQRVQQQLRPQWVSVVPGAAGSAAVSAAKAAARVCLEAGPFGGDGADEAAATTAALAWAEPAQLGSAGAGGWTMVNRPRPSAWWLSAGRYPEAAQRNRREAELRELKLSFELVPAPAAASAAAFPGWSEITPALVISRHASQADADAALAALPVNVRRTLRVVAVPAGGARWWIKVAAADSDVQTRLGALPQPPGTAQAFKPCSASTGSR